MKKTLFYLALALIPVIYFACEKDEEPVAPDTTPPTSVSEVQYDFVLDKTSKVIDTLKLNWEAAVDAGGPVKYKVDLLMYDDQGVPKVIRTEEADNTNIFFTNLSNLKDYKVQVQTVDLAGNGSVSVLKELGESKNPIISNINGNNLSLNWNLASNASDKVKYTLKIFEYPDGNPTQLTELLSQELDVAEFTYEQYNSVKNYVVEVTTVNSTKQTTETKKIKIVSDRTTTPVENIVFTKKLDPSNAEVITNLVVTWEHASNEKVESTAYTVDLYMYDNETTLKKIRTINTEEKTCDFTTLSNTKSYQIRIKAQNKITGVTNLVSTEKMAEVPALDKKATPAVQNVLYAKTLDPDNQNNIKSIKVNWEHNPNDTSVTPEYKVTLSSIDEAGITTLLKTKTTSIKTTDFFDLDKTTSYQIGIVAHNKNDQATYTPSTEVTIKINAITEANTSKSAAVTNVNFNKQINPDNATIIDKLNVSWEHTPSEGATSSDYKVELIMFDAQGVPSLVNSSITTNKFIAFDTKSNTNSYEIKITATDKSATEEYLPSDVTTIEVAGLKSLVTRAVKNIVFTKHLNADDNKLIDKLDLTWQHNPFSSNAIIEYTIKLQEYDSNNELVEITSIKTKETSYSFTQLSNEKNYRVAISAHNIITTELYTPSAEMDVFIAISNADPNTTSYVTNVIFEKKLDPTNPKIINTLLLNWDHIEDSAVSSTEYTVDLHMYQDDGTVKKIRTEVVNTKSAEFNLVSNLRSYRVTIFATNKSETIEYKSSTVTTIEIEGVQSIQTSHVNNIQFTKTLDPSNSKLIKELKITWDHTPQSEKAVIQFTITHHIYSESGEAIFVKEYKTDNKFFTLDLLSNEKSHRISIIASNISTEEIYSPSKEIAIKVEGVIEVPTYTLAPSNISFEKVLDPENVKIIDKLKLTWDHDRNRHIPATNYFVELHMFDDNGVAKKIRELTTQDKFCEFTTISNTKSYKVLIKALNVKDGVTFTQSSTSYVNIQGIPSTQTSPISNLLYEKDIDPLNNNNLNGLKLSWDHTPKSSKAVMEFTVSLYIYDANGTAKLSQTIKTPDKQYIFSNLSNTTSYKVSVLASNISTEEVYVPSDSVALKIESSDVSNLPAVYGIEFVKTLDPDNIKIINKIQLSWKTPGTFNGQSIQYDVKLYMYIDGTPNEVRKTITQSKSCQFTLLDNTKTYKAIVTGLNQNAELVIPGIKSRQTNKVTNLQFEKVLEEDDIHTIKSLNLTWDWEPQSPNEEMQYTIGLFKIDENGTETKLTEVKTFETNHSFPDISNPDKLSNDITYKISLIASNISKKEIYTPSDASYISIVKLTDTEAPSDILNVNITTRLNTMLFKWDASSDNFGQVSYEFKIYQSWQHIKTLTTNKPEIQVKELLRNQCYKFYITPIDGSGNRGKTHSTGCTYVPLPKEVTNVNLIRSENSAVYRWVNNEPIDEFKEFKIELWSNKEGKMSTSTTTDDFFNIENINTLPFGNYYIKIFTINIEGVSSAQVSTYNSPMTIFPIGTYNGNLDVNNQNYANNFKYHKIEIVNGNVTIDGTNKSVIDINALRGIKTINGNLTLKNLEYGDVFNIVGLLEIENITGDLIITGEYNHNLTELPALKAVGGNININNSKLLSLDGLNNIGSVGGSISIYNNVNLHSITGLKKLKSVNEISLLNNALLKIEGFDLLETVTLDLKITDNQSLITINGFPALLSVGDELDIERNSKLTTLGGFNLLNSVTNISINGNSSLDNINVFNTLESVNILAFENNSLTMLPPFTSLTTINNSLTIKSNKGTFKIDGFNKLTSVSNITIHDNPGLKSITNFEGLTTVQNIKIDENEFLKSIDAFNSIGNLTDLSILSNGVNTISGFSSLGNMNKLTIENNTVLTTITAFANLKKVNNDILLRQNYALTSLDWLNNVEEIGNWLLIYRCSSLNSLSGLNSLITVNDITIEECNNITTINGFSNVTTTKGFYISNNNRLSSVSLNDKLTSIVYFWIIGSNELTSVTGLSGVTQINTLKIHNLQKLESINALTNLSTALDYIDINNNTSLKNIDFLNNLRRIECGKKIDKYVGSSVYGGANGNLAITGNYFLANFCGLQEFFKNDGNCSREYTIENNAYNPDYFTIISGNCSK